MNAVRILTLAAGALFVNSLTAQEPMPPKPGPEQEQLKQMAGVWDAKCKCNFPGVPAMESKGELTAKMDVGGLFLFTDYKGEIAGAKFQGRGMTGYDPFKKKYTGVWVDSMSPALYTVEGSFDKDGKVYTEKMEGPDPTGKIMKMRTTTEFMDKDHMLFKIFGPGPDGKEFQMMEIAYSRRS